MKIQYKPLSGNKISLNYNDEIKNNLENLKIQSQIFAEEYEINREDKPIFSEYVLELMDKKKLDRPIFKDRTLLSDSTYTRLINRVDFFPNPCWHPYGEFFTAHCRKKAEIGCQSSAFPQQYLTTP